MRTLATYLADLGGTLEASADLIWWPTPALHLTRGPRRSARNECGPGDAESVMRTSARGRDVTMTQAEPALVAIDPDGTLLDPEGRIRSRSRRAIASLRGRASRWCSPPVGRPGAPDPRTIARQTEHVLKTAPPRVRHPRHRERLCPADRQARTMARPCSTRSGARGAMTPRQSRPKAPPAIPGRSGTGLRPPLLSSGGRRRSRADSVASARRRRRRAPASPWSCPRDARRSARTGLRHNRGSNRRLASSTSAR